MGAAASNGLVYRNAPLEPAVASFDFNSRAAAMTAWPDTRGAERGDESTSREPQFSDCWASG